jgi:histidinol-phosphatase
MSAADELRRIAATAHGLLDETDALALEQFRIGAPARRKPNRTWVTDADLAVERRLRERIGDLFPSHVVEGEEFGGAGSGAAIRWVVDPIDATHNFMRGIDVWATLLALVRDDEPVLGLVSAPALGCRWWAIPGEGAWLRRDGEESAIAVSSVDTLEETQLLHAGANALDGRAARAARSVWRDRGFGDFWGHMLVAAGSAEAMVDDGVAPWDMAAPYAIVTAAGGKMTDLDNRPSWTDPRILSSNGLVHDALLALLGTDLADGGTP